jgi:hypothetical protein
MVRCHNTLFTASRRERFSLAEKNKDPSLRTGLITWLSLWRDVLLVALDVEFPVVNLDQEDQIKILSEGFGSEVAFRMVGRLENTIELLDKHVNSRLALEVFMLDLPSINH